MYQDTRRKKSILTLFSAATNCKQQCKITKQLCATILMNLRNTMLTDKKQVIVGHKYDPIYLQFRN
jgi:hypothetical protein